MKLPKKIQIGIYTFTVKVVDEVRISKDDEATSCGCIRYLTPGDGEVWPDYAKPLTIELWKALPDNLMEETLVHEILHGIWWGRGLDHLTRHSEEFLITTLSEGLLDVLQRNDMRIGGLSSDA